MFGDTGFRRMDGVGVALGGEERMFEEMTNQDDGEKGKSKGERPSTGTGTGAWDAGDEEMELFFDGP